MHEMPMCQAVLDAVERRAGDRAVARVGVRVGVGLAVLPEVFEQGFQVLAQGGVADGATTEVDDVAGEELTLTWIQYREPVDDAATTTDEDTDRSGADGSTVGSSTTGA